MVIEGNVLFFFQDDRPAIPICIPPYANNHLFLEPKCGEAIEFLCVLVSSFVSWAEHDVAFAGLL